MINLVESPLNASMLSQSLNESNILLQNIHLSIIMYLLTLNTGVIKYTNCLISNDNIYQLISNS